MTQKPLSEDLLVLARRGDLDPAEERQLRLAVEGSVELQLLHQAGCEFDRESPVMPGDEALLERLAMRVDQRAPRARRRYRIAAWAAAGVIAAGSVAAATWVAAGHRSDADRDSGSGSREPSARPVSGARTAPRPDPISASSPDRPAPPAPSAGPSSSRPPLSRVPGRKHPPDPRSEDSDTDLAPNPSNPAGTLFARANRARSDGREAAAMKLYSRLLERYSGTAEAQQARLTVGEFELQRGRPDRALALFAHYGNGPLAAEALWGQARAYRALGRAAQERTALERLVEGFPQAPCSTAARKRLASDKP